MSFRSKAKRAGDIDAAAISVAYSRPAPGPGRLLVDVTYQNTDAPGSGIARVVDRILAAFKQRTDIGMEIVPVAAINGHPHYRAAGNYCRKLGFQPATQQDSVIDLRSGEYFLSLDLNHMISEQAAFIDRLHALGGQSCGVVYDLLPIRRPDWFPKGIDEQHRRWFDIMCSLDRLACISRAVAGEVEERCRTEQYGRKQPQIGSFHLGCDLPAAPSGALPAGFDDRPTFLLVSLLNPRKGQMQTLQAFDLLWKRGVDANLVFAGRDGWGADAIVEAMTSHSEFGKRLFWFNGPTDGALELMYQHCSGVIVASEGEGFGLPVVEALQHRKPVLARDIPVLREVGGGRISYFSGMTAADLASALSSWIEAVSSGKIIVDPDFKPLRWSESAGQLLSIMRLGNP
jgi:glycosyltransferase involved in cell wall biosynthesis